MPNVQETLLNFSRFIVPYTQTLTKAGYMLWGIIQQRVHEVDQLKYYDSFVYSHAICVNF